MSATANGSLDKLRAEIAAKHHVALGPDDPILILHTLNDFLIHDAAAKLQAAHAEALARHARELELLLHRSTAESTALTERTLTATFTASKALLEQAVTRARLEFERAGTDVIRRHQLAATISLCASLVAITVAATLWFAR